MEVRGTFFLAGGRRWGASLGGQINHNSYKKDETITTYHQYTSVGVIHAHVVPLGTHSTTCSVSVSSSTARPKTSAVLVSGSMIRGSPSTANHYTHNKVVVAIKYSLIHYFTIRNSGYQEE